MPHVLALAHELRDTGLRVEYALGASNMRKQLELADARRARYAVVVGPDERARGEVVLRDLRAKSQRAVVRGSVAAEMAGLAGQGAV
jgi:histidyl-tRNA synthetase